MLDINNFQHFKIKVVQSTNESYEMFSNTIILHLRTENVSPGFALLEIPKVPVFFIKSVERKNGLQYLSSNLIVQNHLNILKFSNLSYIFKRQGPSVEHQRFDGMEGMDHVQSIHCHFLPKEVSEWCERPRNFGWPLPSTLSSIINFGCHLVPVGHPHSKTKSIEWRISFSVAERVLVCSFNHIQMQCYAVMKIILKEFIKKKCSPQNQVLCSYFIKTFLFWKFESTDTNFWREDNLMECIMYLLTEFANCLHEGEIRHYFIPSFNLLSIKFTQGARSELLHLYNIIIQYGIKILKECKTFQPVWSKFLSADKNQMSIIHEALKRNFIKKDELMAECCYLLQTRILGINSSRMETVINKFFGKEPLIAALCKIHKSGIEVAHRTLETLISEILSFPCKTHLKPMMIRQILLNKYIESLIKPYPGNKKFHILHQVVHSESSMYDLSTSKIFNAMVL